MTIDYVKNEYFEEQNAKLTDKVNFEESNILCGFLYQHGADDFSLWEVDISEEDQEKIEQILMKYECCGCSTR